MTMLQEIMTTMSSFADLSDDQLIARVQLCAKHERDATANLIAALAELDARKLYLGAGSSSLFTYCTQVLHLSEYAAYARIEAARAARRFPVILELLADGSLTLTTVGLLAQHLTAGNHRQVLSEARHKSKREVEQFAATLRPRPDVPSMVRKLPTLPVAVPAKSVATPDSTETTSMQAAAPRPPERPAIVAPLAPERFKIQMTVSRETHDKLRRVQDLLRHSVPSGDPAVIFDRALTLLLTELERKKTAATSSPRHVGVTTSRSRHVPAAVKREVWKRDGGQCAFVGTEGRCQERGFLEYHHVVPYAEGGATTVDNLELRCRAHNAHENEPYFGPLLLREEPFDGTLWTRSGPSGQATRRANTHEGC
jgi:HNH endonuclease